MRAAVGLSGSKEVIPPVAMPSFASVIRLFTAIVLLLPAYARANSPDPAVSLTVELDDSVYAVHQPIMVAITVTGSGEGSIEIPSLRLEDEFIDLSLSEAGRGILARTMTEDPVRASAGRPELVRIAPGKSQVEVLNLLFSYGSFIARGQPLALSFGQYVLVPGTYSLSARLRIPGEKKGLAPNLVNSNSATFRVLPAAAFPEDTLLLYDFVARARFPSYPAFLSPDAARLKAMSRENLSSFFRSRYLMLMYYASDLPNDRLPVETLIQSLRRAGVPELRRAAVFWLECKLARRKGQEKAAWLRAMNAPWLTGRLTSVRDTWLARSAQGQLDPDIGE
ncbi:MAG TPA: hypothetical protein VK123_10330 [Candidatus Limnocylindrales bacterium]|nr:hypothetical protein [Candidatus Limnocylindrales bacterium]